MSDRGGHATGLGVRIGLSAVVIALIDRRAVVLTTRDGDGRPALPFGPFDPVRDRTFERALRDFVTAQTGFRLGFVEQLYTFGDAGREAPRATPGPEKAREISVGYLALTPEAGAPPSADARWTPLMDLFPWEDRRDDGRIRARLGDALHAWAGDDPRRLARADSLFALAPDRRWNEERVLDRYELLYEAGLVAEAARDNERPEPEGAPGLAMASDHRRILATGLGRLRSKMKYRPVLFDLTPEVFTLSQLQAAAEAVAGLALHKQNFRRGVERTGLVEATGRLSSATGGRPAELFGFVGADPQGAPAPGLPLPAQR
ncbi:NAD regulator [Brevundimonas sp. S30B]|uniref:NUDIX hydrolase n=1 Tax=unclassified Brevundimonas TaxID=2622653 RepID=UPI001072041D|nr:MULTISPECIES: NAD regulator [unclassified Brevundimonas]QBX38687.1 NAD regulator [Brevundimonas sp. MF30-B]TFW01278.1 NAD regulator [Brevundimonas sp. S30B]